jgi:hypothetical protein
MLVSVRGCMGLRIDCECEGSHGLAYVSVRGRMGLRM